jgi:ribonucleoside-triphosphate reductase
MFDELMKGGGVGFSVTKDNIAKLPPVATKLELTVVIGRNSASYADSLKMGAVDRDAVGKSTCNGEQQLIICALPDTREGWVLANAKVIDHHFAATNPSGQTKLVLDITNIRPKGARIHGFGGTASGPMPLS